MMLGLLRSRVVQVLGSRGLRILMFVAVVALATAPIVAAQGEEPPPDGGFSLQDFLDKYAALGGIVAIGFAAVVNIAKAARILPDGAAPIANGVLNLAGFFVLGGASLVFGLQFESIIPAADAIVKVLVALSGLIGQMLITAAANAGLQRAHIPLLAFKHSK